MLECNCHSLICKSSMEYPQNGWRKILYSFRSGWPFVVLTVFSFNGTACTMYTVHSTNSMNKSRYFGILCGLCLFFVNNMLGSVTLVVFFFQIGEKTLSFESFRLDSAQLTVNVHWKYWLLLFVAVLHINKSNIFLTRARNPTMGFGLDLVFFCQMFWTWSADNL